MNQKTYELRKRIIEDTKEAMIVAAARTATGIADNTEAMAVLRAGVQGAEWRAGEVADSLLRHYAIRERVRK